MTEPTILDTIVARRRLDVAEAKRGTPFSELEKRLTDAPPACDFVARLRRDAPDGRDRGDQAGIAQQGRDRPRHPARASKPSPMQLREQQEFPS